MGEDLKRIPPAVFVLGIAVCVGGAVWFLLDTSSWWGVYIFVVGMGWALTAAAGAYYRNREDE